MVGITPAWAGKSAGTMGGASQVQGSPPRGRGKGPARLCNECGHGITPAWAGKSRGANSGQPCPQDHPRVGGEKFTAFLYCSTCAGSPPRGRGKVKCQGETGYKMGITPAWAGKSVTSGSECERRRDHPRVGGEKLKHPKYTTDEGGSPPRGRGKAPVRMRVPCGIRITPAWAGKRPGCGILVLQREDHPRVGGEKYPMGQ